ncbi:3-keto-L-gulonate-6-phosphate decarboxylase UlaD [Haloimpatiens sp. FM7315]|uniref:3-keto-L-gulonate-6-phosphate decarboxylase UlaD n=1 Tax=Haloimpatiens sp. FM7315 TaxID=3298609 RepID=UPI0035A29195
MKILPKLQIALDNTSLESALDSIRVVGEEIDVIEAGTILCVAEGMKAVKCLKALYPQKIVLADIKAADAGSLLAKMCYDSGADWMTVICCAPIATMEAALKEAKTRNCDVQIELYGDWTFEQAAEWREAGIEQVVYHRGRDAQAAGQGWGAEDIDKVKKLSDMGFKVTVTGGLVTEDLHLFKDIPVYTFIAGRSIRNAKDPKEAAREFKKVIAEYWG